MMNHKGKTQPREISETIEKLSLETLSLDEQPMPQDQKVLNLDFNFC